MREPERTSERARALIDRQLAMLDGLAQAGLNLAVALERRAMAATCEDAVPNLIVLDDGALAYARVARAVRQTIMLQSKLVEDLQALDRGEISAAHARRRRIERIVERVIDAGPADGEAAERLMDEARERLEDGDIYGDVLDRPVSEVIDRICRDLGLAPDWNRLADEAWAREEIRGDAAGSPLATWMAALPGHPHPPPPAPFRPPPAPA